MSVRPNHSEAYRPNSDDFLTKEDIESNLRNPDIFQVDVRKSVTSTNTVLKEEAEAGLPQGYVVAAETQTAGKGRQGRSFYSPPVHGVYFSVLLRFGEKSADASLITCAAAVAAARAIEDVFDKNVGIKWVNDLFLDEKKVCGILTEANINMEDGRVESAVLGIGINITKPPDGYPKEIETVATSLIDRHANDKPRCRLIAKTLDYFWEYYLNLSALEFLEQYRSRSILIGRDVYVMHPNEKKLANVITIDEKCRLVVRYETGEIAALNSGEVSVVGLDI